MRLGDGYSVHHISDGWNHARLLAGGLPEVSTALGFCARHDGLFVCQVALLDVADGPWMIAEYLVIEPGRPLRVRHEALSRLVPMIESVALAHKKRLMFPNSSPGVAAGLRRMGVAFESGCKVLLGGEVP